MQKAFRLFMATLTMLWSSVAFADVAPSTWGAVKELYRGQPADSKASQPQVAMTPSQWHAMSNAQRNATILAYVRGQVNMCTPYNCKTWVQHIIPIITGGAVTIPPTTMDGYGYYWYPAPYVGGYCTDPWNVQPGQILQMWYGGYRHPHTAIVDQVTLTGQFWIDCNFDLRGSIMRHFVPFSSFGPGRTVNPFTVNQIY